VSVTPWDYNKAAVIGNLTAAGVTSFDITVCYNIGNDGRRLFLEAMRDGFAAINPLYKVTVLGEDWPTFLTDEQSDQLPLWNVGWLADFADDDNFARTYMGSHGAFSFFQHVNLDPISPTVDTMLDQAVSVLDPFRDPIYEELQTIYHDHAWALPTIQAVGRGWHRDWVRNVEINQLYPGIYFYLRYKAAGGALQNVDVDVTHTITPIVSWPTVYVYKSKMVIGYQGVGPGANAGPAVFLYQIKVSRLDSNAGMTLLATVVGVRRDNTSKSPAEMFAYPNSTTVLLGPSTSATINLTWCENTGSSSQGILPATTTGVGWRIGARGDIAQAGAQDTNTTNNYQSDGSVVAYGNTLVGDINGDGIIDILDAITLAGVYGTQAGQTRYNADANLNPVPDPITGKQVIDIYDAITLANNFGRHLQP